MNTALPNSEHNPSPNLRFMDTLRFGLPLLLFVLATGFEVWEHWLEGESLFIDGLGLSEVFIFGLVGPILVFGALTYLSRILGELEQARITTAALNHNLFQIVDERTAALQTSHAELQQANVRLQQLDEMKSDFVALVSHELRAPLATLNGGIEVARQTEELLPPKAQRVLNLMSTEISRLTQFVQTLLDVSQLEAGKLSLTCGPVAVRPMLARATAVVLGDEANRVVWHLPPDLPPVWADEIYAEQAIRNLLRNAQKYTPAESPLEFSAVVRPTTLQICVTDYGPGIPTAEQAHIFERFFRTSNNGERKTSGWGLGLYFARALLVAQSGQLEVQSPVHGAPHLPGSRFVVTLPIAEEVPDDGEIAPH
ncbi:MAG: ATP-binding protein [Chloroflexi bacterium]|nr:ATP-binding protein [Chloroflexota bacterium]